MDISENLRKNREIVEKNIEGCDDIVLCTAKLGKQGSIECFLVYPEQAVENVLLENSLIGRMLGTYQEMEDIRILENLRKNGLGIANEKQLSTMEEAMTAMLAGNAVLFVQGWNQVLKIDSKGYPGAGVGEAESEKVIRGSREAFSESVKTNAALIRKRVRDTRLKVREFDMGTYSGTKAAVLYMEGLVYPPVLKELNRRLKEYQVNSLEDAGVLEHLTEEVWYSPFPQYQATERPGPGGHGSFVRPGRASYRQFSGGTAVSGHVRQHVSDQRRLLPAFSHCILSADDPVCGGISGGFSARTLSCSDKFSYPDSAGKSDFFLCRCQKRGAFSRTCGSSSSGTVL